MTKVDMSELHLYLSQTIGHRFWHTLNVWKGRFVFLLVYRFFKIPFLQINKRRKTINYTKYTHSETEKNLKRQGRP